jgi:hypothetical protein
MQDTDGLGEEREGEPDLRPCDDEAIFSFFLGGLSVERRNKLATESRFAC